MSEQPNPRDEPQVVSTQEARSGETSGHVRTILGVSMSLTVIGLGVVLLIWISGA
jgi:hypothetical protein